MGDFNMGATGDPYHLTDPGLVDQILAQGISPSDTSESGPEGLNDYIDHYRPRGYPRRGNSVFLYPGDASRYDGGRRIAIYIDVNNAISGKCLIADMETAQRVLEARAQGRDKAAEDLARQYWERSRRARLAAVNNMGDLYERAEILCGRIPPSSLYTT